MPVYQNFPAYFQVARSYHRGWNGEWTRTAFHQVNILENSSIRKPNTHQWKNWWDESADAKTIMFCVIDKESIKINNGSGRRWGLEYSLLGATFSADTHKYVIDWIKINLLMNEKKKCWQSAFLCATREAFIIIFYEIWECRILHQIFCLCEFSDIQKKSKKNGSHKIAILLWFARARAFHFPRA